MDVIDLRSDTVSHPTPAMREAMANAVVGDDVYGDDPTVNQLEHDAAAMFGQEAGLLVSSGTQANLVAMLAHCQRGDEVILGDKAHTFVYEQAGVSALGGIMPRTIPVQEDGTLKLEDIEGAIRTDNIHFPVTRLVSIENTQGTIGGVPLTAGYTQQVAELAHKHDLKLHIDGARIFNAATALNVNPQELMGDADSLYFCLSKGLCAPVGSVMVGSAEFIKKARRVRKVLGGGMRQAGVLAAAGLIALHEMTKRLQEDHDIANFFATELQTIPGIRLDSCHTNFVMFWLEENAKISPSEFEEQLAKRNIIAFPYPGFKNKYRFVTYYWITRDKAETVVNEIKFILS